MWNSTGTVSVTNGSPVVTGAGTVFSFPNAQPGQAFVGPNGLPMEIASVDSASQITLARPYGGATAAGQPFTILPTQSFANDLALAFAGFKNTFGGILDTIGQGLFPDGTDAAPGMRFAADQDTGIMREGSNVLGLTAGGQRRFTIDGSGAFVSGNRLEIRGGTTSRLTHATNIANWSSCIPDGTNRWAVVENQFGSEKLSVLSNGNVGVGTVAPAYKLDVASEGPTSSEIDVARFYAATAGAATSRVVFGSSANALSAAIGAQTFTGADGGMLFYTTKSGVLREVARIDNDGNLLAGIGGGSAHALTKSVPEGSDLLYVYSSACLNGAVFGAVSQQGWNAAKAALYLGKNSGTGRSIGASGTINASGADYAEYVRKSLACGTILKGDVCGIDSNGELTRTWADARRYVVKSTDPNLVGGDTWAAHLGPRPEAPVYSAPAYDGPSAPSEADGRSAHDNYTAAQADYAKAVAAAEAAHAAAVKDHAAALTAWEAELEAARQTVDRIAFSGQVPVNVDADTLAACQAALGDGVAVYLVAVARGDGIGAAAVRETDMTLPLYMRRLGAVWAIRDGRPWVDVQHG